MGHQVTVKQVARLSDDDHGHCDMVNREIIISTAYPLEQRWRTLFHESLHMVFGLTGLSELLRDDMEESVIVCLENNFMPIVEDVTPKQ